MKPRLVEERFMSLSQRIEVSETSRSEADREPHGYGFILGLVCAVLILAVVATIFAPVNIGEGVDGVLLVGP
jgi:hypothetical protein